MKRWAIIDPLKNMEGRGGRANHEAVRPPFRPKKTRSGTKNFKNFLGLSRVGGGGGMDDLSFWRCRLVSDFFQGRG